MNYFDRQLKKALGVNKTKGASRVMQKKWAKMTSAQKVTARRRYKDTDRDGVPNRYDCLPYNRYRQDSKQINNTTFEVHGVRHIENNMIRSILRAGGRIISKEYDRDLLGQAIVVLKVIGDERKVAKTVIDNIPKEYKEEGYGGVVSL